MEQNMLVIATYLERLPEGGLVGAVTLFPSETGGWQGTIFIGDPARKTKERKYEAKRMNLEEVLAALAMAISWG